MHGTDMDIDLDHISKIEGHAGLELSVRDGKVTDLKLKFTEYKRFYTQAMRGKMYHSIPAMVSHICGTCSIAHQTAAIEAVERAVGATPSEQTLMLRKLSLWGLNLRDHAMHLYLFCLPDLYGKDSVLDMVPEHNDLIKEAFRVKSVGNHLCTHTIGAPVHPTHAQVGRFSTIPEPEHAKELVDDLLSIRPLVLKLIKIFHECDFTYDKPTKFVAIRSEDFSYLGDTIVDSTGKEFDERGYFNYLERVVIPYSQATGFKYRGTTYMLGALARMNLHRQYLHKDTRRDCAYALKKFPSSNRFDANLAQAIEMLNAIDSATDALESYEFKKEETPLPPAKPGIGIGAIEAPRGTLYYKIKVLADGRVEEGIPVIPTAQNQVQIEKDIKSVVEQNINQPREKIELEIEKLVRSYDPCVSCAAHFLKFKWKVR